MNPLIRSALLILFTTLLLIAGLLIYALSPVTATSCATPSGRNWSFVLLLAAILVIIIAFVAERVYNARTNYIKARTSAQRASQRATFPPGQPIRRVRENVGDLY